MKDSWDTFITNLLLIMPGGHSGEVIPVPIPNTEVKLSYVDDTAEKWESRKLPGFFYFKRIGHFCWSVLFF